MKILVISQYFAPEPGATSNRLTSFVDAMVKRGHEVEIICEFPNHPTGKLDDRDKWKLFRVERNGSYKIIRTFVMAFEKKNNLKRILFYISFAISSFIAALFRGNCDIVFTSSPPIFHAFTSMIIAKIKRADFVLDIRDIWPDTVFEFKAMSSPLLLRLAKYLERSLYKNARLIFGVTRGIKAKIETRGASEKVHVVYNGTKDIMLNWEGDIEAIRKSAGWNDNIVILYAGVLGLGQNLAEFLPDIIKGIRGKNITLQFIGGGPQYHTIKRIAAREGNDLIKVSEPMSYEKIVPYIHSADILLVTLIESDFFKEAIPSKYFDYMAAGKPVLTNVDGELRDILETYNTGLYFSFREEGSFDRSVNTLIENRGLMREMGVNGRKLVADRFMRADLCSEAMEIIEKVTGPINR